MLHPEPVAAQGGLPVRAIRSRFLHLGPAERLVRSRCAHYYRFRHFDGADDGSAAAAHDAYVSALSDCIRHHDHGADAFARFAAAAPCDSSAA